MTDAKIMELLRIIDEKICLDRGSLMVDLIFTEIKVFKNFLKIFKI